MHCRAHQRANFRWTSNALSDKTRRQCHRLHDKWSPKPASRFPLIHFFICTVIILKSAVWNISNLCFQLETDVSYYWEFPARINSFSGWFRGISSRPVSFVLMRSLTAFITKESFVWIIISDVWWFTFVSIEVLLWKVATNASAIHYEVGKLIVMVFLPFQFVYALMFSLFFR